jgi:hypothetical protein
MDSACLPEPSETPSDDSPKVRAALVFNKKQFRLLKQQLEIELAPDTATTVVNIICKTLHFDPQIRTT